VSIYGAFISYEVVHQAIQKNDSGRHPVLVVIHFWCIFGTTQGKGSSISPVDLQKDVRMKTGSTHFPHSALLHTHARITAVQVCSNTKYCLYTLFNCTPHVADYGYIRIATPPVPASYFSVSTC